MKNNKGFTVIELLIVLFLVVVIPAILTGWVKNVIKLSDCDFSPPYKAEIIHTVGLFPPVGAITGWIDVGK